MSERWVTFDIGDNETLRCTSCSKYLHDQKGHLFLDVDDELDDIMCECCWREDQKEMNR